MTQEKSSKEEIARKKQKRDRSFSKVSRHFDTQAAAKARLESEKKNG